MIDRNSTDRNESDEAKQPTHIAKVRHGTGKAAHYERIGVAWESDDGRSVYVRLQGTQIVADGFTLYPIEKR